MSTFRVHKSRNYTIMSNHHFQNENLSLRAMGLLSYMLSKPDDWKFSVEGIAAKCRDGKDSVRSAVKELEKYGYIVRRSRIRDENGHLKEAVYDVYETPNDNPDFAGKEQSEQNISANTPTADDSPLVQENANSPMAENPSLANKVGNSPMAENSPLAHRLENSPMADFPTLGKPVLGNPTLENPTLLNTNILNTNITNNLSINQVSSNNNKIHIGQKNDVIDEMDFDRAIEEVSEQISAESLYCNNRTQSGIIDEIIEVIANAYTTKHSCLKIGGDSLEIALVRKRLRTLDSGHIEYVLECISNNSTAIKNRKSYLLTCLFKAPVTMDGYYSNQVAHDLAWGG